MKGREVSKRLTRCRANHELCSCYRLYHCALKPTAGGWGAGGGASKDKAAIRNTPC